MEEVLQFALLHSNGNMAAQLSLYAHRGLIIMSGTKDLRKRADIEEHSCLLDVIVRLVGEYKEDTVAL